MKAMLCEAFGGPETLAWRDLPERYGPRTTCYNRFCDGGRRASGTG